MITETAKQLDNLKTEFHYNGLKYWGFGFTRPHRIPRTFGKLPKFSNGPILDFGCYNGETTKWLSKKYPSLDVIGVEYFFDRLPKKTSQKFVCGDGLKIFKPESFEAVFCLNNLYYQLRYKSHYEDLEKRNQDITKAENIMKQMLGDLGRLVQEKGYLFFSGETHDKKVNKIILRKNEKIFL